MYELYKLTDNLLAPIEGVSFSSEKEMQNVIEANTEALFGLRMVKSEFNLGEFRIDSLCFNDKTKSFVIIEYKKGTSSSVIDQAAAYKNAMLDNKADCILEFQENLHENLKRNEVNWNKYKIIIISPYFNAHQKGSIKGNEEELELWEITKFSNNTIGLNKISSTSKAGREVFDKRKEIITKNINEKTNDYDEAYHLNKANDNIKELYFRLIDRLSKWEHISYRYKRAYISVWNQNIAKAYLYVQQNKIKIELLRRIDFKGDVKSKQITLDLRDPNELFDLKKNIYKETYIHSLVSEQNLDEVVRLMKQKYDS